MAEWSIVKTPQIPDLFKDIRPVVDNIFTTLNLFLGFLNSVLEFVKAFIIDFTNPLLLLIRELIALIKNLINDFLNLGVYLTTDLDLVPKVFDEGYKVFAGGYSAFERRMVTKFTNATDVTRPVISSDSLVIAIFQYAGATPDAILKVINAFNSIKKLFTGILEDTPIPTASNIKVELTKFGIPISNAKLKEPDAIKVSWTIEPPSNSQDSFFPSFVVPPEGFIVNISTMPVNVGIVGRVLSADTKTETELYQEYKAQLFKSLPLIKSGKNEKFFLKGSPNLIDKTALVEYKTEKSIDEYVKEGYPSKYVYYFKEDKVMIPEGVVKITNKSFYYNPYAFGAFITGNNYSLSIPLKKLPRRVQFKSKAYNNIDIADVNPKSNNVVIGLREFNPEDLFIEILGTNIDLGLSDGDEIPTGKKIYSPTNLYDGFVSPNIGKSAIQQSKIPSVTGVDFYSALKEALAIYILGDYINEQNFLNGLEPGSATETNFKDSSLYDPNVKFYFFNLPASVKANLLQYSNRPQTTTSFVNFNQDAEDFRNDVLDVIQNIVNRIPMPSPSQLNLLSESIKALNLKAIKIELWNPTSRKFEISKYGFYDLLKEKGLYGLHGRISNFGSLGADSKESLIINGLISDDELRKYFKRNEVVIPDMFEKKTNVSEALQLKTLKGISLFYDIVTKDMVNHSRQMISTLPQKLIDSKGAWYFTKFFIDGLPDFTAYLNELLLFMEGLAVGIDGLIKAIKDFIEVLQKRIQEIQRIIARLKALIDAILNFNLNLGADIGMLFLISQGTDGVLTDFLSASNKPTTTYGLGQCVVIPGPPAILADLISALFGA